MIFVTVGTHEDPFDRLVEAVDQLKKEGRISRDVFIQTGYSTYKPQHCDSKDFISFQEMNRYMTDAEIVITHGGTGSIMLALYHGKIPVVVPRQSKYNEHIDNHQVLFCETMANKGKILAVYETSQLEEIINRYPQKADQINRDAQQSTNGVSEMNRMEQRAALFAGKIKNICMKLVEKKFVK